MGASGPNLLIKKEEGTREQSVIGKRVLTARRVRQIVFV